jgi:hypothetical protein
MQVIRLPCARPIGSRKAIAPRHVLRHLRHYVRASGNWSVVKRAFISKSSPENIPFDKRWDGKRFAQRRNSVNLLEVSLAMQHGGGSASRCHSSSLNEILSGGRRLDVQTVDGSVHDCGSGFGGRGGGPFAPACLLYIGSSICRSLADVVGRGIRAGGSWPITNASNVLAALAGGGSTCGSGIGSVLSLDKRPSNLVLTVIIFPNSCPDGPKKHQLTCEHLVTGNAGRDHAPAFSCRMKKRRVLCFACRG